MYTGSLTSVSHRAFCSVAELRYILFNKSRPRCHRFPFLTEVVGEGEKMICKNQNFRLRPQMFPLFFSLLTRSIQFHDTSRLPQQS